MSLKIYIMVWMGEVEMALEKYFCFTNIITILIILNDFIVAKEIIIISVL